MLKGTKKPHRVQVTISLTLICAKCINFCKAALIVVLSNNQIAFCSVHSVQFVFFFKNSESVEVFKDTILCHFTALFYVVSRCFGNR